MGDAANFKDAETATNKISHRWIWFVTGPTACGKTTIAKFVAEKLNLTFLEGDDVSIQYLFTSSAPRRSNKLTYN